MAKLLGKKEFLGQFLGEFGTRIKWRRKVFLEMPDSEYVTNTIMEQSSPMEKWKDVENWQRKLNNKYNSGEFAKKHDCKVAGLYWKGKDVNTINFENLPNQYVIRPTIGHSSRGVFLMNNSINLMDGKTYVKEDVKEALAAALDKNKNLEFLVEEFLRTESGEYKIPDDYKFYMFNGEVATIQVINRVGPSKGFTRYYNENWQVMKNVTVYYPKGAYQPPPKCLAEMIQKTKELSKSYEIFVRIDFYATDNGAVFGEFTPLPSAGNYYTPAGDKFLADYWDRFCKGMI
jgi:hypothetical protein